MKKLLPGSRLLAPMVKGSILPFRLLCLRYGADFVYSEETIAHRIIRSSTRFNSDFNTTELIDETDGTMVFSTRPEEKDRLVFQLGVADPDMAVAAAKIVQNHVCAIDVNMGCPKKFSVAGGMGAALLQEPEKAAGILKALVSSPEINVPITCKVRLMETAQQTADFIMKMKEAGACQVALHMRRVDDRPTVRAQWNMFAEVQKIVDFELIANGDFFSKEDINNFAKAIGDNPVMIARGAQWNPVIFDREEKFASLGKIDVVRDFLKLAVENGTVYQAMKIVGQELMAKEAEPTLKLKLVGSKATINVLRLFELDQFHIEMKAKRNWPEDSHTLLYYKKAKNKILEPEEKKENEKQLEENLKHECAPSPQEEQVCKKAKISS